MSSLRNIMEAIHSLNPNAEVHAKSIDDITWVEGDVISKSDIETEITRLQAEYDAQEYARNRASAYDSIGNQLDMMMKDKRDGTTTHQTACEAVKAQFPKPE
jgi:hypothetical protein